MPTDETAQARRNFSARLRARRRGCERSRPRPCRPSTSPLPSRRSAPTLSVAPAASCRSRWRSVQTATPGQRHSRVGGTTSKGHRHRAASRQPPAAPPAAGVVAGVAASVGLAVTARTRRPVCVTTSRVKKARTGDLETCLRRCSRGAHRRRRACRRGCKCYRAAGARRRPRSPSDRAAARALARSGVDGRRKVPHPSSRWCCPGAISLVSAS
mmetsp:Transcript_27241/g.82730  ORF Transcript_27241/g.82730 Transcript_27241/m.82730 type:complete len:213 (+) Transcript_27241:1027-1665(+)